MKNSGQLFDIQNKSGFPYFFPLAKPSEHYPFSQIGPGAGKKIGSLDLRDRFTVRPERI